MNLLRFPFSSGGSSLAFACALVACGGTAPEANTTAPPAPAWTLPYTASLYVRALDVSCAPPDAQPGIEGCLALFHYRGAFADSSIPEATNPYGAVLFVRTDAAGKLMPGWPQVLLSGFDPISNQTGAFLDDDLRVHLLASGEFLVSGTYEGRVFVGTPGGNNQEFGPSPDRSLFMVEFHKDGTFDNWEDAGSDVTHELRAFSAVELPSTNLALVGTCSGDVPLDQGSYPCGDVPRGFVLITTYDCSTLSGLSFGGTRPAEARDVIADPAGNLYISGSFEESMTVGTSTPDLAAGGRDAFVMRLNPDGSRAWIRTAGSLGPDRGGQLALINGGFLWTAQVSAGARIGDVLVSEAGQLVTKLDFEGKVGAATLLTGIPDLSPLAIAARPDGSFALAGPGFLARFDSSGRELWRHTDADVRAPAFAADSLFATVNFVGTTLFGAPVAGTSADAQGAALVAFKK